MPATKSPPAPKRGRPRRDPSGVMSKGQMNLTITERQWLIEQYGNVSAGLRAGLELLMRTVKASA